MSAIRMTVFPRAGGGRAGSGVFPEYSLSPEAKYPTAIEGIYAIVQ
jgi:hypothetical protein